MDTGHSYRQHQWTARLLGIAVVVEAFVIVALALALVAVFPLKEIQPMLLIGGNHDDQIWRVEPFERGARGFDLIAEKLVIDYVVKRETIDLQTDTARWQEVVHYSSVEVFAAFEAYMKPENPNSPYRRAQEEQLTRTVTPIVANMLNPYQWQVEFERRDFRNGVEIDRRTLVATLTLEYRDQEVALEDRYINPMGLTVVAYGLAEKSGS